MIGQVTATSLNLRSAPAGLVTGWLIRGTKLDVLGTQDGWAHVSVVGTPGKVGWVSASYVGALPAAAAPIATPAPAAMPITTVNPVPIPRPASTTVTLPPADDAAHPAQVVGPSGQVFASVSGPGFYTSGETSLAAWLESLSTPPAEVGPSARRVVRAMCINEGGLEAINSYDDAFLSIGIFQWTAGPGGDPGELALLVKRFHDADPAAFDDCLGRYGLSAAVAGGAFTGTLAIGGAMLGTAAEKAQLRNVHWAYRFWRAGHHPSFRGAELALAASRLGRFLDLPLHGHTVSTWLTSEYGIALVLDEHVNRPGHVPGTLADALEQEIAGGLPGDPARWTTDDEARFIEKYLAVRVNYGPPHQMTDSAKRALKILECVRTGQLSSERGSFSRTG